MLRNLKSGIRLLILSYIPLAVGLGFIYIMIPGGRAFLSGLRGQGLTFLIFVFLFPFSAQTYLSWLAWIISGFVGGLLFRAILVPFIFTLGYAWVIFYFGGGFFTPGIGFMPASWTARIIILNTLVAGISFLFGGWIGSSIRH